MSVPRIPLASGRSIRKCARCVPGDCVSTPLQAVTHYRSNYPDGRWHPIIKVATNTSDSIKSEVIVIKRNGVFCRSEDFPRKIIGGRVFGRCCCAAYLAKRKIDGKHDEKRKEQTDP